MAAANGEREREGGRSHDGEEDSSQPDGAGRLSMPRSAQARVRVLLLSVFVSFALLPPLIFPFLPTRCLPRTQRG